MDKLKIGKFLRELREKKGKTQNAVALELVDYGIDVSDKTIAKWEKGNYPDFENLDVIADYYGVKPADILDGEIYVQQNFEDKYFIVNNEWLSKNDLENPYYIRIEQENNIKERVKYLFLELIRTKSLTRMQNDELNFLLSNFYSVSKYAERVNTNFRQCKNAKQGVHLLRHEIYRTILSMRDCDEKEVYWEIDKFIEYNKRFTFANDLCDFEDDIEFTARRIQRLEDWEKDLLLAQVQTENITHRYGQPNKNTYFKRFKKDYDEDRITREGIRLLIDCGAMINLSLFGYKRREMNEYYILDLMEDLYNEIPNKLLISKLSAGDGKILYYWIENTQRNRLLNLYYALNVSKDKKLTLDEICKMFNKNDIIPFTFLLENTKFTKNDMTEKERLWQAEMVHSYEIKFWNECKESEHKIIEKQKELRKLINALMDGQETITIEENRWVGKTLGKWTEEDIAIRLSYMTFEQFDSSRNEQLTRNLYDDLVKLSLKEIREKYFQVEVRDE